MAGSSVVLALYFEDFIDIYLPQNAYDCSICSFINLRFLAFLLKIL